MEQFYQQIAALLSRPVPDAPSLVQSALYPPGMPPDLVVYVGEASRDAVSELRGQLPPKTFLLVLHPADEKREEAGSGNDRTLFCPLADASHYADKTMLLISSLPDKQVRLIVGGGYRERASAFLPRIEEAIVAALDNAQQDRNRGLIRLKSSLRNLPSILAWTGLRLARVPPGTAAIICGAGPSLSRQFEQLEKYRDRAILIAVGHAAPSLLKAGIEPDVVVEVDAHAGRNWPEGVCPDALLVACTEVAPEVAARFSRIWWCAGSSPAFNEAMKQGGVPLHETQMAKTVTVPAIDFAVRLGCSPILLAGQEFCLGDLDRSHVDGEKLEGGDERVELPGNDEARVVSTRNLAALHDALQKFLGYLNGSFQGADYRPEVINATLGGARIEGTLRGGLESFLEPAAPLSPAARRLVEGTRVAASLDALEFAGKRLLDYEVLCGALVECSEGLRSELEKAPVNMQRVRQQQRVLQQLVSHEDQKRREEFLSAWVQPLVAHVDTVAKETPGAISSSTDPFMQLRFLAEHYRFLQELTLEIRREVEGALSCARMPEDPGGLSRQASLGSPLVFEAFRAQAIRWIRRRNADLADYLLAMKEPASLDRFDLRWLNQFVPFVKIHQPGAADVPLSGFVSMFEQAAQAVRSWVDQHQFDPSLHAVIFASPGNWSHVIDFAKRYPAARIMVMDPWPGLLSAMIQHGCFLHWLPADTLILGVHDDLPSWRKKASDEVLEWKKAGLFPLVFAHPSSSEIQELRALVESVEKDVTSFL
ncbi:MAG: 6-hydroxymethylpterin diphosphokinase MptE-like protein [Lentisphaerota bacterium]